MGYTAKAVTEEPSASRRCPALFGLLMRSRKHSAEAFSDVEPVGPLEGSSAGADGTRLFDVLALRRWAEGRRLAVATQMRMLSEVTSEAATNLLPDPEDGLALTSVAVDFFKAECPIVERNRALGVFHATAERLRDRRGPAKG